jgi:hypothetical protein
MPVLRRSDIGPIGWYIDLMEDAVHFRDMLKERGILPEWANRALVDPDKVEDRDDGTRHFS